MKTSKRIRAGLMATLMLCVCILTACKGNVAPSTEPNGGEISYTVSVKDAQGNPYGSDVIVRFLQNGQQAAMQMLDENGVAEKTLPAGEYTVELMYTDSDARYSYDTNNITLTAEKAHLDIVLARAVSEQGEVLWAGGKEHIAYRVQTGSSFVSLVAGQRNYFLFVPTESGTYEFSVSGANAKIGYYGAPHFVQDLSAVEVSENNTFTISVSASMIGNDGGGTSILVIGLDAPADAVNCYLNIVRIGEPEYTIADEPWTIFETTAALSKYILPENAVIRDFDLTASTDSYNLVYNSQDGFYHLNSADGPLVLARLAQSSSYLDSYKIILENTGVTRYFFDADGNFLKKESYTECLLDYLEYVEEDAGVYPLTPDLMYIFQNHGEYSGWWNPSDARYRFVDADGNKIPGINNEIAWLFLCCYIGE